MARERLDLRLGLGRLEVDPAHHAGDEGIRVGELEQPSGFLERLACLHRDARVHTAALHHRVRVGRKEIAAQRAHRAVDPPVLERIVTPEMQV